MHFAFDVYIPFIKRKCNLKNHNITIKIRSQGQNLIKECTTTVLKIFVNFF